MKKSGLMLAMASMMMSLDNPYSHIEKRTKITSHSSMTEDEKMIKKGLKKFYVGNGIHIWALNEKTAIKKYNKKYK